MQRGRGLWQISPSPDSRPLHLTAAQSKDRDGHHPAEQAQSMQHEKRLQEGKGPGSTQPPFWGSDSTSHKSTWTVVIRVHHKTTFLGPYALDAALVRVRRGDAPAAGVALGTAL